eukprot:6208571-Ditylum_brightwellii.AAC.1
MQEEQFNYFSNCMTSAVASNKERLQWHQDHDATIRIKSIFCGYSAQKQLHLQSFAAVTIQAFI